MDSDSSEHEKKNYCVYLLLSQNPRYFRRIYIGFTVDPNRRLKQHNAGSAHGGANKTNDKGPWEMLLVVHGFPHEILALRFEWAWQHPCISRRLKHLQGKKTSESSLHYHLRVLNNMVQIGPWKRLPIFVQWLKEPKMTEMDSSSYLYSISYASEVPGAYAMKSIRTIHDTSRPSCSSVLCFYCYKHISNKKSIICPSMICNKFYHVVCLAKCFLVNENEVVPLKGYCPSCSKELLWCDLIAAANDFIL